MESKSALKSITLWFNFLSVLLIVLEEQLQLVKPLVSEEMYTCLAIFVPAVNIWLRMYITQPIEFKKKWKDSH